MDDHPMVTTLGRLTSDVPGTTAGCGGAVVPIGESNMAQPATLNMTGWWLTYPSEKYEFVSWDDYSHYMEK